MAQKHGFNYVKQTLNDMGYVLLSESYTNTNTKLEYVCTCGNVHQANFNNIISGKKCPNCYGKTTWNLEKTQTEFEKRNCILLEETYINNSTSMHFLCSCGEIGYKSLQHFLKSPQCKKCGYTNAGNKNGRFTIEKVRDVFEEKGYILLENVYVNNYEKLSYICSCGSLHEMSFANISKNKKCPNCHGKTIWNLEKVKDVFKASNCLLLASEYINSSTNMNYQCSCGNISNTTLSNFLKGVRCFQCGIKKLSGNNNYNYNEKLTTEERRKLRECPEYRQWRKDVLLRDECCVLCGENNNLVAHHLQSYMKFPESRTIIENGITLCKECHINFHKQYGFVKGNTKEQFLEFKEVFYG